MYAILNRVPIEWSSLILDTMLKAERYPQYPLPYSLLISRICEYKGVDTTGELCQNTLRANEIAESSLKQLKRVPLGDTYVHRDDMPNYDAEDEDLPPPDPIPPATQNVGSSSGVGSSFSIEDNIANMNKRLEELFLLSTSRHEEVVGLIRGIDTRISNLEHRFDKEFTHDDDMSAEF
ncbi:hypothetical protein DEO72_LG6g563 [Vigna unguiculata]|uniref:Uncharacterized protein n=1 Tax=Vigna unguiculata TaxID=3917 RepID=A0A4D6M6S1_VIGUN|nr:hypothetical protein DEO72_LG6g563 [Vigna unguiculata]